MRFDSLLNYRLKSVCREQTIRNSATHVFSLYLLAPRSMVGLQILDLRIGVRIPGGQPNSPSKVPERKFTYFNLMFVITASSLMPLRG